MLGRFRSPPKPFTTGKEIVVQIKEVRYNEARLMSTAQYENARVEIGITVAIDATEDPTVVLSDAKAWVREALIKRLIEMEEITKRKEYVDNADRVARKYRL
jgi:hypothetical protein